MGIVKAEFLHRLSGSAAEFILTLPLV